MKTKLANYYVQCVDSRVISHPLFDTESVENFYTNKDGVPVKYVCTTALDDGTVASDIFYRDTPHPEFGNRYFGISFDTKGNLIIHNADKVEELVFACLETDNGYYYSAHRHDYRITLEGTAIDGGRAYTRVVGYDPKIAYLKVKDGKFVKCELDL